MALFFKGARQGPGDIAQASRLGEGHDFRGDEDDIHPGESNRPGETRQSRLGPLIQPGDAAVRIPNRSGCDDRVGPASRMLERTESCGRLPRMPGKPAPNPSRPFWAEIPESWPSHSNIGAAHIQIFRPDLWSRQRAPCRSAGNRDRRPARAGGHRWTRAGRPDHAARLWRIRGLARARRLVAGRYARNSPRRHGKGIVPRRT